MSSQPRSAAKTTTRAVAIAVVALAMTPAAGVAQTPAPVTGTGQPGVIPDQYIVVMKGATTDSAKERTKDRARRRGGRINRDYQQALRGYAATLPPAALADVRNDPDVAYIEADAVVQASTTQSPAIWGLDRIDQASLPLSNSYTYEPTGSGVKAYVIDTGIRFGHQQYGGRAISGYDAIDGGSADDCNGHGTHVAGTIGGSTYGVAKAVSLVGVRVLGCNGSGSNSGVIAGVNWVTTDHQVGQSAVANMSLGGSASSALDTAVQNSIADGVTYAVAAGNESSNACNSSPGRAANALTVGATTSTDARASYSNYGTCLDLFAPGSGIMSSWYTSDTATASLNGTSMATPHVAGVAALYLQANTAAAPATVASALTASATANKVSNPGSGSPNRLLYSPLGAVVPPPPPPPPPTGCALAFTFNGSLGGTNASAIHPTSYSSSSGVQRGCLRGPATADFDLFLEKRSVWGSWSIVARAEGDSSSEDIAYTGTSGTYRWRVKSYSGSGAYQFAYSKP